MAIETVGMKQQRQTKSAKNRIRFGLCCIFRDQPIRFRGTTAKQLNKFPRAIQLEKLSTLCLGNCKSLQAALRYVNEKQFGAFRILSPFFPRFTHPEVGYTLENLPDEKSIRATLKEIKRYRKLHDIRLSFHPDQFIILSSPHKHVAENSIRELEYQGMLAELIGADVINIHGGGKYENKVQALKRFAENFQRLSANVQKKLTLENDDRIYTVADLLPLCKELAIPLVYDLHHHRCNSDGLSVEQATILALDTWKADNREPYFHISSPKNGWQNNSPKPHADYIDLQDFPECWKGLNITVDVEAKAKELAVIKLMGIIGSHLKY
jgi:UV DNA damage endonuclease